VKIASLLKQQIKQKNIEILSNQYLQISYTYLCFSTHQWWEAHFFFCTLLHHNKQGNPTESTGTKTTF